MQILYHTTSFEAFHSIIRDYKSGFLSFRAYSPIGTSDNRDTQYFLEMLRNNIRDSVFYEKISSLFCPREHKGITSLDHPFIICFSRTNNSNHIWDSFGDGYKGVAIGLNLSADLSELVIENDANLGIMKPKLLKCHYWGDSSIKQKFVKKYSHFFHENELSPMQQRDLLQVAAMIKAPSYKLEHETRIVIWVANKNAVEHDKQRDRDYIIVKIPIFCVKEIIPGDCISTQYGREIESFKTVLFKD